MNIETKKNYYIFKGKKQQHTQQINKNRKKKRVQISVCVVRTSQVKV